MDGRELPTMVPAVKGLTKNGIAAGWKAFVEHKQVWAALGAQCIEGHVARSTGIGQSAMSH